MTIINRSFRNIAISAVSMFALLSTGCVTFTRTAIPAYRLPTQFQAPTRCNLSPINFAMLERPAAETHIVAPGDTLGITVQGVIPADPKELPPLIQGSATLARVYYPPGGSIESPNFGLPVTVTDQGKLALPLVDAIEVNGLSLPAIAEKIRKTYVDAEVAKEGRDQVNVVLIRSRVNRIVILREDASIEAANTIRRGEAILHKRGSSTVVDLPVFESDVLHALAASGGLPGVDAYNEVWILRRESFSNASEGTEVVNLVEAGETIQDAIASTNAHMHAIRIPLKLCPDEPVPFTTEDIILKDGDIVYVEPRRDEYFYTGGLLPGGQIPFPRDEDLDVMEAIALAQGSVGGFGATNSTIAIRSGAGPGAIVPPTRVLVLRKVAGGQQLGIRVDLSRAMRDPAERIRIMPGDYIMMHYKPSEIMSNVALNIFNFNWTFRQN